MSVLQAICSASLTQESDRTDEDWTREQTKTQIPVGETNLMSDQDLPSSQYNPDPKPEEIDKINIDKLNLGPDCPQEELLQIVDSLIPPPTTEEMGKTTTQEKTDVGTDNDQQEEEDYEEQQKIYVGQLSKEESNTSSDFSGLSYYT